MSSLRLALKMSIEDIKTPSSTADGSHNIDTNKGNKISQKNNPTNLTSSTLASAPSNGGSTNTNQNKQKRKRNENNDEKIKKLNKTDDANTDENDEIQYDSDIDEINNEQNSMKNKNLDNKKKKVSPQEKVPENSIPENYDHVDQLVNRSTPPIGIQLTNELSSSKKGKDKVKTPVPIKNSKNEKSIVPVPIAPEFHDINTSRQPSTPSPIMDPNLSAETSKVDEVKVDEVKVENVIVPQTDALVEAQAVETPPVTTALEPEPTDNAVISIKREADAGNVEVDVSLSEVKKEPEPREDLDDKEKTHSKKSMNKRKRRGGLDMSEAEELLGSIQNQEPVEKVEELDESAEHNRGPSRAAAMAAKSKINSTTVKGKSEIESKKVEEPSRGPVPAPPQQQSPVLKAQWVACDKCSKWRRIPGDVDLTTLPEQWYCSMNLWDTLHNDCSHVEEEYVEVDEDEQAPLPQAQVEPTPSKKTKNSKSTPKSAGNRRGRKPTKEAENNAPSLTHGDSDDEGEGYMGTRRRRKGISYPPTDDADLSGPIIPPNALFEKVHWVQCGKCSKWRKVPGRIHEAGLPDVWYCAMNTWALEYSRCSAKEEEDDTVSLPPGLAEKVFADRNAGRGRYVRKTRAPDSSAPSTIRPWVQCERKNCKKWRKLPAHVDVSTLPEKWYCEMNTWDPERATCDASEETDSESENPNNAATRSQLILGNSKGPGTLSYRRLIFGTDGRIRPFYSEKNKNGYGLFSYTEVFRPNEDEYVMPTRKVSYWWSSAYQDSGVSFTTSSKSKAEPIKSKDTLLTEKYQSTLRPSETQHLIDCILRLSQSPTTNTNKHSFESAPPATKWSKIANESKRLSLFSRINLCCQIIRLCLVNSYEGLTLNQIYDKILTMYFHDAEIEVCRNSLGLEEIKETLYRLEQFGEIEVTYNNEGLLLFRYLLQIIEHDRQVVNPYPDILSSSDPYMEGRSRPLKMRKKKLKSISVLSPNSVEGSMEIVNENDTTHDPSPDNSDRALEEEKC